MNYDLQVADELISLYTEIFVETLSSTSSLFLDEDMIDIATLYIKEWCKANTISHSLISNSIEIWKRSNNFPSLEEIINYYNSHPCECSLDMDSENRKSIIRLSLINMGISPPCHIIHIFKLYIQEYNAIPTYETIINIIRRMDSILNHDYFEERIKVGTKNLQHIKTLTLDNDTDSDCSLCMEKISIGQKYYKLEPCGHMFHADEDNCIGSTIIKWLTDNHTCPNCRKDVIITEEDKDLSKNEDN
jgi:hypothetical protein